MDQKTIRQQIRELLTFSQMDAREISQQVQIREKEVYEHLMHINRSLAGMHKKNKYRVCCLSPLWVCISGPEAVFTTRTLSKM